MKEYRAKYPEQAGAQANHRRSVCRSGGVQRAATSTSAISSTRSARASRSSKTPRSATAPRRRRSSPTKATSRGSRWAGIQSECGAGRRRRKLSALGDQLSAPRTSFAAICLRGRRPQLKAESRKPKASVADHLTASPPPRRSGCSRSAVSFVQRSRCPSGHSTMTASIAVDGPSPKCTRASLADR